MEVSFKGEVPKFPYISEGEGTQMLPHFGGGVATQTSTTKI